MKKFFFVFLCIVIASAFQFANAQTKTYNLSVDARTIWQSTGIFVPSDSRLRISYVSGSWTYDPNSPAIDWRGGTYVCRVATCGEIAPSIPNGRLLFRFVGGNDNYYTFYPMISPSMFVNTGNLSCGYLQFSMNDDFRGFSDNRGALQIKVEITENSSAATNPQPPTPVATPATQNPVSQVTQTLLGAGQIASNNGMEIRMYGFDISASRFYFNFDIKNTKSNQVITRINFSNFKVYDNNNKFYKVINGYGNEIKDEEQSFDIGSGKNSSYKDWYVDGDFSDPRITTLFMTANFYGIKATWKFEIPR